MQKILFADADVVLSNVDLSVVNEKDIIVTGASGLIGTHIVFSLIRYVETTKANVKLHIVCLRELPSHFSCVAELPWINVIRGDLTDTEFIETLPMADIVIHCAGYASPGVFMADKEKTLKINTISVFGLLEKVKQHGKFCFLSSSSVYTDCLERPYKVSVIGNTNTVHPRSCYIEGKKCGETICYAYRDKEIDAKSVRLSIIYGPGTKQGDVRALNSFISSAIEKKKIQLLDDGKALKSYMYISDAIELMWKMILYGEKPVYNLGGNNPISILKIAQIVGEYLDVPVIPGQVNDTGVAGAVLTEELDMSETYEEFSKQNHISIREGIEKTIKWNLAMRKE